MNAQDLIHMEIVDAFVPHFVIPTRYNRKYKLEIIQYYCSDKFRKATSEEQKTMKVFQWEIDKMFNKKPVFIIDDYITENNINLYHYAQKICDYKNASVIRESNTFKINNTWYKCDIERFYDIKVIYDIKSKLNTLYLQCYRDDNFHPLFDLYYKGFTCDFPY